MEAIGSHLTSVREDKDNDVTHESNRDEAHKPHTRTGTADTSELLPKTRIKQKDRRASNGSSAERPPSMDQKMTAEDLRGSEKTDSRNAGTHNFESAHKGEGGVEGKMMKHYNRNTIEKGSLDMVAENDDGTLNSQAPLNSSMADGTLKFSSIREIRSPKSYKIKSGGRKGKSLNHPTGSQNNQGNESTRRRHAPNDIGYFA